MWKCIESIIFYVRNCTEIILETVSFNRLDYVAWSNTLYPVAIISHTNTKYLPLSGNYTFIIFLCFASVKLFQIIIDIKTPEQYA